MKRECSICGIIQDDYWMHSYNAGSKIMWLCWECHRTAQREANLSDNYRHNKLQKIAKSKEANK